MMNPQVADNGLIKYENKKTLSFPELVVPAIANGYGTLFAVNGLALLGKTAFLCATQFAGGKLVMASANKINFLKPVPVGTIIWLNAEVVRVGKSSLTVNVTATLDNEIVLSAEFILVAVDDNGKPKTIVSVLEVESRN